MNIILQQFNDITKHANEAADRAFRRASEFGYCPTLVRDFAKRARKASSLWERPEDTAFRIVPAMTARNERKAIA